MSVSNVMLKISIDSGNEAFSEHPIEEVIRILEGVIETMRYGEDDYISKTLRDVNGNNVGNMYFEIEEEEKYEDG